MTSKRGVELFVGRLSSYITNQELKDMFTPFGVIKAARLVRDPKTQKPKGFGFVEFESKVDAQKAVKVMNGRMVNGGIVFVEVAENAKAGKERREGHGYILQSKL